MLYLLRSFSRKGTFLKIGFTRDINKRMTQYLIENPGRELISTREGDMKEETRMHLYLTAWGVKADFLEEWFKDCNLVLQEFHQCTSKINKMVWKNREKLFTAFDFSRRSFKVQIYEELRFQHRAENLNSLQIDKEWKQWNLKRDIENRSRMLRDGLVEFLN